MKIQMILSSAAVALALSANGAFGQIAGPSGGLNSGEAVGDLILGFSNPTTPPTNGDLVFDIGNASEYNSTLNGGTLTPGSTYTVSAFSAGDVTTTFGSNAFTSGNVVWGVTGANGLDGGPGSTPVNSLWAATPGTALQAGSAQSSASQSVEGFVNSSVGGGAQLGDNQDATNIPFSVGFYNLANNNGGASNGTYGYFQSSVLGTAGTNTTMTLYELIPPHSSTAAQSIDLGTFTLNSSSLTFTAYTAIPEPSTYAAILGALVIGFVLIRRRTAVSTVGSSA